MNIKTWLILFVVVQSLVASSVYQPHRRKAFRGGGSFTPVVSLVGSSQQNLGTSAASISTPSTINVQAGDIIVLTFGYASNSQQDSVASSSPSVGTFTEIYDDQDPAPDIPYQQAFYAMVATSTQTGVTFTGSWTTAGLWRDIGVVVLRTSAGTFAIGQNKANVASPNALSSTSTSRTAQNLTTTVADTLLVAMGIDWDGVTHTAANGYTLVFDGATPFCYWKQISATGLHPNGNFGTTNSGDEYYSYFLEVSINP